MKLTLLCTDRTHPIYPIMASWADELSARDHAVSVTDAVDALLGGDMLFLLSVSRLVPLSVRKKFRKSLVLHASKLPDGRGWSPHIWDILGGKSDITVTLLEADDPVDTGAIWGQRIVHFEGHELYDEINARIFSAERDLIHYAVTNANSIVPQIQGGGGTYHRRRVPEDSRIDPTQSIASQFDLLRVADPTRYPAFFDFRGHRYALEIRKVDASGDGIDAK